MRKHTRREFLRGTGAGAAAMITRGCTGMTHTPAHESDKRPNIILILVDDMGYSDLGCYGGEIHTPNIDGLAHGGVRFTQFYNAARCCPTRASLLTGLYPHQVGVGGMVAPKPPGPYQGYLNRHCVTIAEVLREAGYRTLMSGKWHVGEDRPNWPTDRGFDRYLGLISGAANYFDITKGRTDRVVRKMAMDDAPYMPPKDGFYMTDAITDYAIHSLESDGRKDKPFFLYVAYTAPHWPLHAWPEDIEKYRGRYLCGWDVLRDERYERITSTGIIDRRWQLSPRDLEVTAWAELGADKKGEMALKMAVYAAQIDRMDQGVGGIMDTVRALGKEKNTLLLFLSDNGACHETGPWGFDARNNGLPPGGVDSYMSYGRSWANASNTPFRLFKRYVHEGGIATPLVAYWPAVIKQGAQLVHQPGHIIDIMATCCELAGTQYPETFHGEEILPLEGKSLLPVFQGRSRDEHPIIYWEHSKNRAVRQGQWKLVSVKDGKWELYDLEADRTELNDLTQRYPEKVKELNSLYHAWAERWGVSGPS